MVSFEDKIDDIDLDELENADSNADLLNEEKDVIDVQLESKYVLKWQEELKLHLYLNSSIILEGNTNDMQIYASEKEETYEIKSIETWLYKYLHSVGYKTVIFFNSIEGFYCKQSKEEYKRFFKLAKKDPNDKNDVEPSLERTNLASSALAESLDQIRYAMKNRKEPVAIVMTGASRYISCPSTISDSDHYLFSKLALSTKEIITQKPDADGNVSDLHNIMFFVAEKVNDIPAWFYLNNPLVKTITIPIPDLSVRKMFIDFYYKDFEGNLENESEEEILKNKNDFVAYTEGFKIVDLESLRKLMNNEHLGVAKVSKAVSKYKYGIDQNPWEDESLKENLGTMEDFFEEYVKGQKAAIKKAADIIKSAVLGLSGLQHSSSKSKPRGVMFLAGPTGTGKTELAKTISRWLFKTEESVIRFDMSEYSQSHSDQRLLGAPPGYVGYEQGGQLTEAVKRKPFSILLFDEIEKAHPSIFDKFLQILEDGRMTDGKGETVYFSDTLIIFTSNIGMSKTISEDGSGIENAVVYGSDGCNEKDPDKAKQMYDEYFNRFMTKITAFFQTKLQRPEIQNRIGENFIVFNFISKEVAVKQILAKQISKIKSNLKKDKNITLDFSNDALKCIARVVIDEKHISYGGRGVGNVVESMIIRPLSNYMVQNNVFKDNTIMVKDIVEDKGTYHFICD